MNPIQKYILLAAFSVVSSISISARAEHIGPREAISSARNAFSSLRNLDFQSVTQNALNQLVSEALTLLEQNGEGKLAQEFRKRWERESSIYFADVSINDLGDHAPLSQYLADLYKTIKDRIGPIASAIEILEDINTMNYAIPVVFQPAGDQITGMKWSSVEYRRHFIPFTQISLYWISYGVCSYYAQGEYQVLKQLCKPVAKEIRKFIGRHGAPELSDWVWGRYNGSSSTVPAPEFAL